MKRVYKVFIVSLFICFVLYVSLICFVLSLLLYPFLRKEDRLNLKKSLKKTFLILKNPLSFLKGILNV